MARIAIGGFQHETNTFAPSLATLTDFEADGPWPGLTTGPGLPDRMRGMNLSIAGFIDEAERTGHRLLPTTWGATSPSSYVTEHAYEHIAGLILDGLRAARPFDAVYLCLHGAMVTEHLQDGEGELLRRVRALVGNDIPVVASLDFHSNTTPEMVGNANALVGYRTYPHIDMADTGRRTARRLDGLLNGSSAAHKSFRQLPFIIPITWQCTTSEPMSLVMEMRDELEGGAVASLTVTAGFPAADIHHCGPSVFGYGSSPDEVERAVEALASEIERRESEFEGVLYSPDDGVRAAIEIARHAARPVVIADTQDNPGAGETPIPPGCCGRWWTTMRRARRSGCWSTRRRRSPRIRPGRGRQSTSRLAESPAFRATLLSRRSSRSSRSAKGDSWGRGRCTAAPA